MSSVAPTGAVPMPPDGMRRLTAAEAQRRARALACLRTKSSECQGQVHVNIFFDGTGNNKDWNGTFVSGKTRSNQTQLARNGHSNVARLFDVRLDEAGSGFYNFYVPGVGTPFSDIGDADTNGDMFGGAAALYGADRIHWAILQVFNAVHRYVTEEAGPLVDNRRIKDLVGLMSKTRIFEGTLRRLLLRAETRGLEAAVKRAQRKAKSVNISVFGFSRGSAQARAFVHRLYEVVDAQGDGCGYNLGGVPMQLSFLGIFDTVASVGLAGISRISDGKMAWAEGQMMSIHPEVKKCVHFAALHEQRMNFPMDLAAGGEVKEVLYPGMHSDVGGGYTPGGQGKDFVDGKVDGTAKLAQIPLLDMHFEAVKAGVLIRTIDEIKAGPNATHFGCHPQLIRDYNAWLTGHGLGGGAHREQTRKHCRQYVQWKGARLWPGDANLTSQPFYKQADSEDKVDLDNAQRDFESLVRTLAQGKADMAAHRKTIDQMRERMQESRNAGLPASHMSVPRATSIGYAYARAPSETHELLDLVLEKRPLPEAATRLFDNYVHDSLAGFYMSSWTELNVPLVSTYGYLRYRSVFNIASTAQPQVCSAPVTNPAALPPNPPSLDQLFNQMGTVMGR